jgi:hypothetical protein
MLLRLLMFLVVLAATPAQADTGLLDAIRPALSELAIAVMLAVLSLAYRRFSAWTGIQIEARHREALQSALANGIRSAMQPGGQLDVDRVIDDAMGYVERSVPDALAHFKVGHNRLRELLQPHAAAALKAAA